MLFRSAELLHAARLCAPGLGVEGHLVRGHEVDLLHDVDLAALRPVRALGPEPGPDGAPVGQVHGVEDEEGADGEVVVRRDPDLSGGRVSNEAWARGLDARRGAGGRNLRSCVCCCSRLRWCCRS